MPNAARPVHQGQPQHSFNVALSSGSAVSLASNWAIVVYNVSRIHPPASCIGYNFTDFTVYVESTFFRKCARHVLFCLLFWYIVRLSLSRVVLLVDVICLV